MEIDFEKLKEVIELTSKVAPVVDSIADADKDVFTLVIGGIVHAWMCSHGYGKDGAINALITMLARECNCEEENDDEE